MKKVLIIVVVIIALIRIVPFVLGYSFHSIPSRHMLPTMEVGAQIIVDDRAYNDEAPKLGDLVTYASPKEKDITMVGRIAALPNSTIELKDGVRFISGNRLDEDYIDPQMNTGVNSRNFGPYNIPKNALFVLGDNRDNSFDSRYFGHIPVESVVGKVIQIN